MDEYGKLAVEPTEGEGKIKFTEAIFRIGTAVLMKCSRRDPIWQTMISLL